MLIKHTAYSREASGGTLGEQVYALGLSPPRYSVPSLVIRCEFEPEEDYCWPSAWYIRYDWITNGQLWVWTVVIWEKGYSPKYFTDYPPPRD